MTTKDRILLGFVIVGFIVMTAVAIMIVGATILTIQIENNPEQSEQVEVTGKRISVSSHHSKGGHITFYYSYYVAFKFTDSSEKEFRVGSNSRKEKYRGGKTVYDPYDPIYDPYDSIYNFIHEGDTGTLTFKEIKNSTEPIQRHFICFEKDF